MGFLSRLFSSGKGPPVHLPDDLMERTWDVPTDTAAIAVFDPSVHATRAEGAPDWWCQDGVLAREADAGRCAVVKTGSDGVFRVRLTPEKLKGKPRATLWFEVRSGRACLCAPEHLPGGGAHGPPADSPSSFPIANGRYQLEVHTPASKDVEAPDYVLAIALLPGERPSRVETGTLSPAQHPSPRSVDHGAVEQADENVAKAVQKGDVAAQLEAIERVLRLDPRHRKVLNLRSTLKNDKGDREGALADAVLATTASPDYGLGWNSRAYFLLLLARPAEALLAARRAVELLPDHPFPWNNLADALEALGRGHEAVPYWQKALALDHDWAKAIKAKVARHKKR